MTKTTCLAVLLLVVAYGLISCGKQEPTAPETSQLPEIGTKFGESEDPMQAKMLEINAQLQAQGLNIAIESIEYFTIGQGRPSNRIHQNGLRWVANDPRRAPGASGTDITYIVDATFQGTSSGVSAAATEARIDASMATWDADKALKKLSILKTADPGIDVSIFDEFFIGAPGNPDGTVDGFPFAADIVNVGFYPASFFQAVTGVTNVLAFSVSFIFIDGNGNPTDINGDNYLDTALNEVYYNDGFSWGLDVPLGSGIDVETVALHENGHSLQLGHFGPPPDAVMNPVYAGIRQSPLPTDHAGMAAVWGGWPK